MSAIAMAAMLMMSPAAEIRVDVGEVRTNALPPLRRVERSLPTPAMVDEVERILAETQCRLPGQTPRRFDIDVPYAVLVEPDGAASRVVVSELGCPELESYAGLVVLEMARRGEFMRTGENKARWFASTLNFNLE